MGKTNFEKYNRLHNEIMRKLENGEITTEQAKEINDLAFEKYITEGLSINRLKKNLVYDKNKSESSNLGVTAFRYLSELDKLKNDSNKSKHEKPDEKDKIDTDHVKKQNEIWRKLNALPEDEYEAGKRLYYGRFHRNRTGRR